MLSKFVVLLVVVAIIVAAAWLSSPPKPERDLPSRWLRERRGAHREFVHAQSIDGPGSLRYGDAPPHHDAIRRLYRECGSY